MGVYIKNMKMPPSCGFCKLAWCCKAGEGEEVNLYMRNSSRHPNCPLIEIKTHGDLIDRDRAIDGAKVDGAWAALAYEPAVIEAEGK